MTPTTATTYRALLIKYMARVLSAEGVSFIEHAGFSDRELRTLRSIEQQARAQRGGASEPPATRNTLPDVMSALGIHRINIESFDADIEITYHFARPDCSGPHFARSFDKGTAVRTAIDAVESTLRQEPLKET